MYAPTLRDQLCRALYIFIDALLSDIQWLGGNAFCPVRIGTSDGS
jgi:hypothetical protein